MIESLKKALLSMLGAVTLSPEEVRKTVDDLVSEGTLTPEQAAELSRTLLGQGQKNGDETGDRFTREFQRLLARVPLVGRGELHRLEERVRKIEDRMGIRPEEAPNKVDIGEGEELGEEG